MPLTSTEQLFIERPLCRRFLHNADLHNSHLPYRLYNFPSFRSSHWRCSVRKSVLRNFAKFTGKVSFLIKLQAEATVSDLSHAFSWRFVYFISTEKLNEKMEIPWWSSNIYFFARVSICLVSKISKEIWQMVI